MKKAFTFFVVFFSAVYLFGYQVTMVSDGEAFFIAQNWVQFINKMPFPDKIGVYTVQDIEQVSHNGHPLCTVYHLYPQGHIVVPLFKEMSPVKSFSLTSDFDVNSGGYELAVLEELKISLDYLKNYDPGTSLQLDTLCSWKLDEWSNFIRMQPDFIQSADLIYEVIDEEAQIYSYTLKQGDLVIIDGKTAPPLIKSKWSQGSPFWNHCPTISGDRCYVGCVATAMVQIMRYYKWPRKGEGSKSYYWSDGGRTLYANFSDKYNWGSMPLLKEKIKTSRKINSVAELCYEAGVSVSMSYGTSGSGSYTSRVADALKKYFKYSKSVDVEYRKDYNSLSDWFDVLKEQRKKKQPVEYRIYGSRGGHAVVVDGYLTTGNSYKVHINMGWDGNSDAYYHLDHILDFTGTYWQYAVLDIVPSWGKIKTNTAKIRFTGTKGNGNPSPKTFRIKNAGKEKFSYDIVEGDKWLRVSPNSGKSKGEWDKIKVFPNISSLSKGKYRSYVEIRSDQAGNSPQKVRIKVKVNAPRIKLNTTSLEFKEKKGSASSPKTFRIKNSSKGTLEYELSANKDWIGITPQKGTSNDEWDSISVSVNISGLNPGTHTGIIKIKAPGAVKTPRRIGVKLILN